MYMTLPSNSSMVHYPDNKASHFYTKLPQTVDLSAEYEVGLSEIQFTNSYLNITEGDYYFQFESDPKEPMFMAILAAGLYDKPGEVIYALNKLVRGYQAQQHLKFYYNRATKRASVTVYKHGAKLKLSEDLHKLLKLPGYRNTDDAMHKNGETIMDLHQNMHTVFVYSDIVTPRVVGDVLVPLLRAVPVREHDSDVTHVIFEKPHYLPLSRYQFNTVEILLTSDTGDPISFSHGKTVVTLHFRRRRSDF